jgi:hypothetical protein
MAKDVVIKIAAKDMASKVMAAVSLNVKKMASNVTAASKKIGVATKNMGIAFAKVGAAVSAVSFGAFAVMVAKASEMQEAMGKFAVVFGDSAGAVEASAKSMAAELGVSRLEIIQMLGSMQDLLVPMGVATEEATGMSQQMARLAVDLGSFNNMASEQVFGDLQAAITGSGEVMKKYGVVLNETAVKQELLNMGMDPANADDAAKAQARLNIIMAGTTAAQGDAVRTAGSFANQVKRLKANFADIAVTIGGPFLQSLASIAESINTRMATAFAFLEQQTNKLSAIGDAVAGVIRAAFDLLATAIGVAVGFISQHVDKLVIAFTFLETVLMNLPKVWQLASDKMSLNALELVNDIGYLFTTVLPNRFEAFKVTVSNVFKIVVREATTLFRKMVDSVIGMLEKIAEFDPTGLVQAHVTALQEGSKFLDIMADSVQTAAGPGAVAAREQTPEEATLQKRIQDNMAAIGADFTQRLAPRLDKLKQSFEQSAKSPALQVLEKAEEKTAQAAKDVGFGTVVQAAQSRLLTRGIARDPQKELIAETKKQNATAQKSAEFLSRIANAVEGTGGEAQIEVVA